MSRIKIARARANRLSNRAKSAIIGKQSTVLASLKRIVRKVPTQTPIICPDTRHALPLGRALVRFIHANRPSMSDKDIALAIGSNPRAVRRMIENMYGKKPDTPEQDEKHYVAEKELMDEMMIWIRTYRESKPRKVNKEETKIKVKSEARQKKQRRTLRETDDEEDESDESPSPNGRRVLRSETSNRKGASTRQRFLSLSAKNNDDSQEEEETSNTESGDESEFFVKREPRNSPPLRQRSSSRRSAAKRKQRESDQEEDELSDSSGGPTARKEEKTRSRTTRKATTELNSIDEDDAPPAPKRRKATKKSKYIQSIPKSSPERDGPADAITLQKVYKFCSEIRYTPNDLELLIKSGLGIKEWRAFDKQTLEEIKDILGQTNVLGQLQVSFFAVAIHNAKKSVWKILK